MALDGKVLARAKAVLARKRNHRESELESRKNTIYEQAPRVREIDLELRSLMIDYLNAARNANPETRLQEIIDKNKDLQEERRNVIQSSGLPGIYLDDEPYMCKNCSDTGWVDTKMCKCLEDIYKEEQRASLSNLLKLGKETFDSFDLSFYSSTPAPDTNISPRQSMEVVFEICVEYARKFGSKSMNLFFNGAPGLGKTFLSACIARVVADNGFSVVYNTAASIFSKFDDVKFMRTHDSEESREIVSNSRDEVKRYLECDLFIIDDLGTEMTTKVTIETLYEIINTRLITGRKTLINSNLTLDELRSRYSEQIMSRLEGEYQVLTFYGEDIRKKRNEI